MENITYIIKYSFFVKRLSQINIYLTLICFMHYAHFLNLKMKATQRIRVNQPKRLNYIGIE